MRAEEKVREIVGDRKFLQLKKAGIDFLFNDEAAFLLFAADARVETIQDDERINAIRDKLGYPKGE
jgi:hypothetical protein